MSYGRHVGKTPLGAANNGPFHDSMYMAFCHYQPTRAKFVEFADEMKLATETTGSWATALLPVRAVLSSSRLAIPDSAHWREKRKFLHIFGCKNANFSTFSDAKTQISPHFWMQRRKTRPASPIPWLSSSGLLPLFIFHFPHYIILLS